MITLSKRLQTIASLVPAGKTIADIGTDHAYLPIALIEQGIAPGAVAMDLKVGPILSAQAHIREAGLETLIQTRLSDGLDQLAANEAQVIVIAGMGGQLIIKILERGLAKAREAEYLLLSPQSEIPQVRKFLRQNGWRIDKEAVVLDDGKYYSALLACPDEDSDKTQELTEDDYLGPVLRENRDPEYLSWLAHEGKVLQSILTQLESAGQKPENAARKREVRDLLSLIEREINRK